MRTTVEFDADTAAAVEEMSRNDGIGVSQAVNELIRRGMLPRPGVQPFEQHRRALGLKVDVSNLAQALEDLGGPEAR
ncbi:MAG: CopG family transcriptional regulator [Nocardioidaceae bacterium]